MPFFGWVLPGRLLPLADLLSLAWSALQPPRCSRWQGHGRLHLTLKTLPAGLNRVLAETLQHQLADRPGVNWARWNAALRCAVIDGPAAEAEAPALQRQFLDLVEALPAPGATQGSTAPHPHPGQLEPILETLIGIGLELLGSSLGLTLQSRPQQQRLGLDLAAAARLLDTQPQLQEQLDRRLGQGASGWLIRLADAVNDALLKGASGPLLHLLQEALHLQQQRVHRRSWAAIEPSLCSRPEDHPAEPPQRPRRPCPLPDGTIERYALRMSSLAVAGFSLGVLQRASLDSAAAALLAGLPRPALLGREAFGMEIALRLEGIGALVLDAEALERLDRIDCVMLDPCLLSTAWQPALAAALDAAQLRLVPLQSADANPAAQLRAIQAEGHGVLVLAAGPEDCLAAADLSVGLIHAGERPPWSADVLAPMGLEAAWILLPACRAARQSADWGVKASLIEVMVGLTLALNGLGTGTSLRINRASNLLGLLSWSLGLRQARRLDGHPPLPAQTTTPWHALPVDTVLHLLGTGQDGLQPAQTEDWHRKPAYRSGSRSGAQPLLGLWLDELNTPLTPVLGSGALLSGLVGEARDSALILTVMGLNALISAAERRSSEQRLQALTAEQIELTWVRRAGQPQQLDRRDLRLGDWLTLEAGDVIPADCRLVQGVGVQVDEAVLTGEAFPVFKTVDPCSSEVLAERSSMLYEGTTLVAGQAQAVAVAIGDTTEARRSLLSAAQAERRPGLEARLSQLTAATTPLVLSGAGALLISALLKGRDPREGLREAVALLVAAVSEGLPLLASIAQGTSARRLGQAGVLVQTPRAIEAMGRLQVLCVDKTGTLTAGQINLVQVWHRGGLEPVDQLSAEGLQLLAGACLACPASVPGRAIAHPTDRALLESGQRHGLPNPGWRPLDELPFEPAQGFHACLGVDPATREPQLWLKGAPEVVVPLCADAPAEAISVALQLADQGLRVLAVACRAWPEARPLNPARVGPLHFCGFVVLADPVRDTAREAVASMQNAGVAMKMITGDHPGTAAAIAAQLQLCDGHRILTGPEIDQLSDDELAAAVLSTSVFARMSSLQKLRLIRSLQRSGQVVAMAGDGANDAASIRCADIGIAVGEHATQASRLAADLIIPSGRMEAIAPAVEEGRSLWRSVRRATSLLLGGNLGEMLMTVWSAAIEGQPALNTRQLLLTNLLTDIAPALCLPAMGGTDAGESGPGDLSQGMQADILQRGLITGVAALVTRASLAGEGPSTANSAGLVTLISTQLIQMTAEAQQDPGCQRVALGSYAAMVALLNQPELARAVGCTALKPPGIGLATAVAWLAATACEAHRRPRAPASDQSGSQRNIDSTQAWSGSC